MIENYGEDGEAPFQAAIMESEPFGLTLRDTSTWGTMPHSFYEAIGCNEERFEHDNSGFWACIRAVDEDTIRRAQWKVQNEVENEVDHFWSVFMPWTPTVGTDMYESQPLFEFQRGRYVDVPYIMGM